MKKKTYIKQGAYLKVENNRGTDIKGALNLNKEVLDTLVDKDVIGTTDCCSYFITFPQLFAVDPTNPTEEELRTVPNYSLVILKEIADPSNIVLGLTGDGGGSFYPIAP